MTCPHLEETSALFDGRDIDRTHADSCVECTAFLADAASLRSLLLSEAKDPLPQRNRLTPFLLPAAALLAVILFLFFKTDPPDPPSPFAGLDGGGRAVITVKDAQ